MAKGGVIAQSSGQSGTKAPHNALLVKHGVGKARPSVYDLPDEDHIYGKIVERDPQENAATVIHHWNVNATSKSAVPALDYVTMNRLSAKQGLISPKEIKEYRAKHPVRVKVGDHRMYGGKVPGDPGLKRTRGPLPSDANNNFTYGKPTRPSTPVARLMTDRYQREWLKQLEDKQQQQQQHEKARAQKKKEARTAQPRQQERPKKTVVMVEDPSNLFKMSKFKKVPAKIDSHRPKDDPALPAALKKASVSKTAPAAEPNKGSSADKANTPSKETKRVNFKETK